MASKTDLPPTSPPSPATGDGERPFAIDARIVIRGTGNPEGDTLADRVMAMRCITVWLATGLNLHDRRAYLAALREEHPEWFEGAS